MEFIGILPSTCNLEEEILVGWFSHVFGDIAPGDFAAFLTFRDSLFYPVRSSCVETKRNYMHQIILSLLFYFFETGFLSLTFS
jgi:hypothetical protein